MPNVPGFRVLHALPERPFEISVRYLNCFSGTYKSTFAIFLSKALFIGLKSATFAPAFSEAARSRRNN
jgi:hypothetical protein